MLATSLVEDRTLNRTIGMFRDAILSHCSAEIQNDIATTNIVTSIRIGNASAMKTRRKKNEKWVKGIRAIEIQSNPIRSKGNRNTETKRVNTPAALQRTRCNGYLNRH